MDCISNIFPSKFYLLSDVLSCDGKSFIDAIKKKFFHTQYAKNVEEMQKNDRINGHRRRVIHRCFIFRSSLLIIIIFIFFLF